MGKLTGAVLIDRLCDRMAWTKVAASPQRAAALRLLQEADDWFSGLASHKHLQRTDNVQLVTPSDTVSVPAWVDVGKSMSMTTADGRPVTILPPDKFRRNTRYSYGSWDASVPTECMITGTNTGQLQFVFVNPLSTPTHDYKLTAQQIRIPIADDGTFLMIPETYETSIILKRAELEGKREIRAIVTDAERAALDDVVKAFLDQFRSTREVPKPDSEQVKRKQSEQLQEGR